MSEDEYGILVHMFEKNNRKRVYVHVQEYKGAVFLSIREFYANGEEWRPSQKGITVSPELYPELLHGILAAGDALGIDLGDVDSLSTQPAAVSEVAP